MINLIMLKKSLWLLVIGFLVFSRLFILNLVPATLPHDEMVYAIQAKSYQVQGTTLNQLHRPWMISPFDAMYAELPATIMTLGFLLSSNPLVGAHLASALMGISIPFVLAWLFYGLWQRKDVAIGIGIVAVFNPLLWQMSRLGYDTWYSLWFYLLGASLLVQSNKKLQWLSLLIFGLGFFNYQGFKLLLFPWILIVVGLKISANQPLPTFNHFIVSLKKHLTNSQSLVKKIKTWLPQICAVILALLMTLYYGLVLLPKQAGVSERLNKTIFSDTEKIAQLVDLERRQTFVSPLLTLYTNKASVTLNFMLDRLANAFDLNLLFLQVEPAVSGFSVWVHGLFYWIEGILMIVGIVWLFSQPKLRINGVLLLIGVVGLCLPTLINSGSEWHLLRTMLSYTLLVVFAGIGLAWVLKHRLVLLIVLPLYAIAIGNFTYIYFYRYPVISLDWGNYHERLVARYVSLLTEHRPDVKISVHVGQPDYYYWSYLLYSNRLTAETKDQIAQDALLNESVTVQTFKIDNVIFTSGCEVEPNIDVMIAETSFEYCKSELANFDHAMTGRASTDITPTEPERPSRSFNSIVAIMDSGQKLYILDDQLCQGKKLKSYVFPTTYADIDVEKLDADQFCLNWISDQSIVK